MLFVGINLNKLNKILLNKLTFFISFMSKKSFKNVLKLSQKKSLVIKYAMPTKAGGAGYSTLLKNLSLADIVAGNKYPR